MDLHINVEDGHIENLKIYGVFFGEKPDEQLETHLQGMRIERSNIEEAISPY